MKLAFLTSCLFIAATSSALNNESKYGLPSDALIIEEQSLKPEGYGDRALILWMIHHTLMNTVLTIYIPVLIKPEAVITAALQECR